MHWLLSIHTCVNRMHNGALCFPIYGHQWSQSIPAFATKACELATKMHMFNFCETCAAICCEWPIEIDNEGHKKDFLPFEKKRAKLKTKNIAMTFGKSLILTKYRYDHIPPNTIDFAVNQTMVVYGNRQNANSTTIPICFNHWNI